MSRELRHHISYLRRIDQVAAARLTPQVVRLLSSAEAFRLGLTSDRASCRLAHGAAFDAMRVKGAAIRERGFPTGVVTQEWLAQSLDARMLLRTHRAAQARLDRFLMSCPIYGTRLYGGLKSREAIQRSIRACRSGVPDLWDAVRFRIVAPDLGGLLVICRSLLEKFDVDRVRNYYTRPRQGVDDPYRAIHFEIRSAQVLFVEVQVMTALRDAVGVIDHALVHKRAAPFLNVEHRRWLLELSYAANVLDWHQAQTLAGAGQAEP